MGRDSSAVLSGVNNDIPYHIVGCDKIEGNDVTRMTEEGTSTFIHSEEPLQLREVSMYEGNPFVNNLIIPILINGTAVDAVVDTAAQVTLLGDDFARKLDPPVIFTDSVLLKRSRNK